MNIKLGIRVLVKANSGTEFLSIFQRKTDGLKWSDLNFTHKIGNIFFEIGPLVTLEFFWKRGAALEIIMLISILLDVQSTVLKRPILN